MIFPSELLGLAIGCSAGSQAALRRENHGREDFQNKSSTNDPAQYICLILCRRISNWWRKYKYLSQQGKDFDKTGNVYGRNLKRWEHDYQLEQLDRLHLFDEYIEMSRFMINY